MSPLSISDLGILYKKCTSKNKNSWVSLFFFVICIKTKDLGEKFSVAHSVNITNTLSRKVRNTKVEVETQTIISDENW